ncbi:gas vesicle protein [Dactylosporangium sp. NPDC049742]|uniref:gas vesicle protein n=1 Tax=Dactylosporangium sp. NPDC049742 TaxID=3154737 RepID=UPI003431DC9D
MSDAVHSREVALVDLLDRVLTTGVVVAGDVTIAIADVDLVRVSLRALVSSVSTASGGTVGGTVGGLVGGTVPERSVTR